MPEITPLPSFIRASAQDAANMQMRKACRSAWNDDDWNKMCDTQDKLVRSLYGRPSDHNQPDYCFLRFQVAERLERGGKFNLKSTPEEIHSAIDAVLDGPLPAGKSEGQT